MQVQGRQAEDDDEVMGLEDAAEFLGYSSQTLRKWAREGTVVGAFELNRWSFKLSDLVAAERQMEKAQQ